MKRLRSFATYGLDALITLLALAAAAGTLARTDSYRPNGVQLGLEVVAVVFMIIILMHASPGPLPRTGKHVADQRCAVLPRPLA